MARPSIATTVSMLTALIEQINNSRQSSTHLWEADEFLKAIKQHLEWYRKLLHAVWATPNKFSDGDVSDVAGEIDKLVFVRVDTIKGLCDGTTDKIPFALALLLNFEIGRYSEQLVERPGVALFPITEMNYHYVNVSASLGLQFTHVDDFLRIICFDRIDDAALKVIPAFPQSLVAIGFQYAMVNDVLYNAILFHELGHYLFEALNFRATFKVKVRGNLEREFKAKVPAYKSYVAKGKLSDARAFLDAQVDTVVAWIEELFCDDFGAALLGPLYLLASINLAGPEAQPYTFFSRHPADQFRHHEQWNVLSKVWIPKTWPDGSFATQAKAVITQLQEDFATVDREGPEAWDFEMLDVKSDVAALLFSEFNTHVGAIRESAVDSAKNGPERAADFWEFAQPVAELLERGIVPSTVVLSAPAKTASESESTRLQGMNPRYHPMPSTVMNVARILVESECSGLRARWPGNKNGAVEHDQMLQIYRRLSEWTQKAIEDWILIEGARQ